MSLILDVQGFRIENNKFIVKELAAFDGKKLSHYIFKPPFPIDLLPPGLQKQTQWLTDNLHGLPWHVGFVPIHLLENILHDLADPKFKIYVKGREKAEYIKKIIHVPVIELPEQPKLEKAAPTCFYHCTDYCICALSNVYFLYEHFFKK